MREQDNRTLMKAVMRHREQAFVFAMVGAFLVLVILGSIFHEFWRDEAYTWLLLDSADSLKELLGKMEYMGHPPTWYVFLYDIKQGFNHYSLLQILNVLFIVLAIFLFLKSSPFEIYQKVLFCLGFFPLYQYGVIARPYSLMVLLLFAYAVTRKKIPDRPMIPAAILAAFISIHAHAFVAGATILLFEIIIRFKRGERQFSLSLGLSLALVLGVLLWTFLELIPPWGLGTSEIQWAKGHIWQSFATGFLPDSGLIPPVKNLQKGLGLLLWLMSWFCFRKNTTGLWLYGILSLGMALFILTVYTGYVWHHGFFFIFFIFSLWVTAENRQGEPSRYVRSYLTVLLSIHALMGIHALALDIRNVYSSGKPAASYIEKNHQLEGMDKIGVKIIDFGIPDNPSYQFQVDETQSTLVYLKNKKIYDPVSEEYMTFWKHYTKLNYYKLLSAQELVAGTSEVSKKLGKPLLVIVSRPLNRDRVIMPSPFKKLIDFPSGLQLGEGISLYLFE